MKQRCQTSIVLGALSIALGCAGCTVTPVPSVPIPSHPSSTSGEPAPTARASADGSQVAVHTKPVDGYMDSAIAGTLEVSDGCVVIRTSDGKLTTPVFVAGDVDWDGKRLTMLLTGRTLQLDTEVRLSGGPGSTGTDDLPPGCPATTWAAGPS